MYTGKTVFAQLMKFIPEYEFQKCVDEYKGDYRVRKFSCREHFLVMSFAQLTGRKSLRDIENCLTPFSGKLYHSGISQPVSKSTLADANEKRDWRIYADFAQILIKQARPLYIEDNDFRVDLDKLVYAFDSTTIDLCLSLYPWTKFHHQKGAVKMHTLLDLRGSIPVFIDITEGSVHDVNSLDKLPIEPGSYYMMDKGYIDFHRLYTLFHQACAFFVTRAKDNLRCEVVSEAEVDKEAGLISDKIVRLTTYKSAKSYPEEIRLVVYEDYANNTVYTFMTNDFDLPALSIAELYRERWKVESFFKWIKQHLHIKAFYGTSQNAVHCQIWIAVSTYLLIAIAKKKHDLAISLYTFAQTLGLTLFEKTPIKELFNDKNVIKNLSDENQLSLWDF
ncbi:MAG: IS4 family transposase [Bacteroidales bacterium]|nr:IS4 family transposase [Bacteroidales bacterium]